MLNSVQLTEALINGRGRAYLRRLIRSVVGQALRLLEEKDSGGSVDAERQTGQGQNGTQKRCFLADGEPSLRSIGKHRCGGCCERAGSDTELTRTKHGSQPDR